MDPIINLLNGDPFSTASMIKPVNDLAYVPHFLEKNVDFEEENITTGVAEVDMEEDGTLAVIKAQERGTKAPRAESGEPRKSKYFKVPSLPTSDRIKASELDGVRRTGSADQMETLQNLLMKRFGKLRRKMALTKEYHRLGAVQGKLLDADGEVIYDFFDEFGITKPTAINFALNTATTNVRLKAMQAAEAVQLGCGSLWGPNSAVLALCGSEFFQKLITHQNVEKFYLNHAAASEMAARDGLNANQTGALDIFKFGPVIFANYLGDASGKVSIASAEASFLPINTEGAFRKVLAPHPDFTFVNTPGKEDYPKVKPDRDNELFVDLELYSNPLFMCTRPQALQTAKVTGS